MLAGYGGGGGSSGGLSYGPVFWVIVVIVAIAIVALVAWFMRRARSRRTDTGDPAASPGHP